MTRLGLVPITLGRDLFSESEVKRIINNTLKGAAKSIQIDFKVTVRTWTNRPGFKVIRYNWHEYAIGTDSDIYKFVSGGTRVRYATMTPNFQAKTRVKFIGSKAGRGGVAFISTKKPKPGIKAREFDITIAKKWQRLIVPIFNRAVASELAARNR